MTTETKSDEVKVLHQKLTDCLNTVRMEASGRFIYYDKEAKVFILALHTPSPEKTHEATSLAWDSIPEDLKARLQEANIGFAGKQI